MEWTNDVIFDFLHLYKKEPTLWDYSTPEHKNRNDAYDAWNRIKNKFKDGTFTVKELKKKRDHLMSTYRRQRAKVRDSTGNGSGVDEEYKPDWPFYEFMSSFLEDIYKQKDTKISENDATLTSQDGFVSDDIQDTEYMENYRISPIQVLEVISKSPIPKKASKRSSGYLHPGLNKLENNEKRARLEQRDDDLDSFGKYVASSLRVLNEENSIHAQDEIQAILSKYKLRDLKGK